MKHIIQFLLLFALILLVSDLLSSLSQPDTSSTAKEISNTVIDILFSSKLIYFYILAVVGLGYISLFRSKRPRS